MATKTRKTTQTKTETPATSLGPVELSPAERAEFLDLVRDFLRVYVPSKLFVRQGTEFIIDKPTAAEWKLGEIETRMRAAMRWMNDRAFRMGYARSRLDPVGPPNREPAERFWIGCMADVAFMYPLDEAQLHKGTLPPLNQIARHLDVEKKLRKLVGEDAGAASGPKTGLSLTIAGIAAAIRQHLPPGSPAPVNEATIGRAAKKAQLPKGGRGRRYDPHEMRKIADVLAQSSDGGSAASGQALHAYLNAQATNR